MRIHADPDPQPCSNCNLDPDQYPKWGEIQDEDPEHWLESIVQLLPETLGGLEMEDDPAGEAAVAVTNYQAQISSPSRDVNTKSETAWTYIGREPRYTPIPMCW